MLKLILIFIIGLVIQINCLQPLVTSHFIPTALYDDIDKIDFRVIKFDTSRVSSALNITRSGFGLYKPVTDSTWSLGVSKQSFSSGRHYFHYQATKSELQILVGIYDDSYSQAYTSSFYPYVQNGVSFYGAGSVYYESTNFAFGPNIQENDIIGVYLNFDHSTVTYFVNNNLLGSIKFIPDKTYYASISLNSPFEVVSLGFK